MNPPPPGAFLDYALVDQALGGGFKPRIGEGYLRIVMIQGYPAALNAAVTAMSSRCREVFTMYWEMQPEEALSYREIGEALRMSASTVRLHLIKARRILDEHLERAGWVNVLKRQTPRSQSGGQDAA